MSQAGRFGSGGGGGSGTVSSLTGNDAIAVGPSSGGNLNVVGTGAISVAGNAGTNTLTISEGGSVATTYNEDNSTSATPAAGILNIFGGSNITTAGTGNTVSIAVSGTTNHAVQLGNASGSLTSTSVGTAGQLLVASATDPGWVTPTAGNGLSVTTNATTLAYALTAPVSIANGGTNATTMATTDGTVIFDGTRLVTTATGTSGQVLTSNGAGVAPTYQATAVPFAWNTVTGTSQAMAVGNGYISNNAGLVTMTLPSTAAFGSSIRITGQGAGGWKVAQNAGQTINFGVLTTTSGTGGSLASTNTFDSINLVCIVANTTFNVISSIGNITVV